MSLSAREESAHLLTRPDERMFGLDVCRTIAVLLVVSGHMLQHSRPNPMLASLGFIGLFGVDLFFCLSGFLIGRILLQQSERWPQEKEAGLLRFWYRRWMRTLPLYFFIFALSLKFDWTGASNISTRLSYLVFAQNLLWSMPDFYGLTWSLAVEEWFYFSFPLLLLLCIGLGTNSRTAAAIAIACFVLLPPLLRWILTGPGSHFGSLDEGIRHVMLFRLDSIGFGVWVAYVWRWHQPLFQWLIKVWPLFLALVAAVLLSTRMSYFGWSESRTVAAFYFSVSAFAFAGLIPFFSNLTPGRLAWFNRFVKYTSQISYSMYLVHIFAFIAGIALLRKSGVFDSIYPYPWLAYPIFYGLIYFFSSATYFAVERPFLSWRDRQKKSSPRVTHQVQAGA